MTAASIGTGDDPGADYPGAEHDRVWRRLVAPTDYRNPKPFERYHLTVVGAGPAGLVTAIAAAGLGARVALIEKNAMGGDCLNVGCVPSKALLDVTRRPGVRFEEALDWFRTVRAQLAAHDSVERYCAAGVHVFFGAGEFVDPGTLRVGGVEIRARRIVVATGARPVLPRIPGLAESRPWTNETVFDLQQRPERLAILGGGAVGCELAQAFARLGIAVVLLEAAPRLLTNEPEQAGSLVAAALARDGVEVRVGANVQSVERRDSQVVLRLDAERVVADELLVATGRRPSTDALNLAAAGVDVDADGRIVVDKYLRTTNRRIFAAGDVCSHFQFTHNADAHARICVQNALFACTATTTGLVVPRCVYTDPQIAVIGRTRDALDASGAPFDVHRIRFAETDRGATQGDSEGFAEVLTAPGGDKILGALLVAHDAAEQLAPIIVAMRQRLGLGSFSQVMLPYPTRAEYLKRLADGYNRTRLTPLVRKLLASWLAWRR